MNGDDRTRALTELRRQLERAKFEADRLDALDPWGRYLTADEVYAAAAHSLHCRAAIDQALEQLRKLESD